MVATINYANNAFHHFECIFWTKNRSSLTILFLFSKMSHFRHGIPMNDSKHSVIKTWGIKNYHKINSTRIFHSCSVSSSSGIPSKSKSCLTSRILFRGFGNWFLKKIEKGFQLSTQFHFFPSNQKFVYS